MSPTFIRVIVLVAKKPALSEVQRYIFYSLLKHQLTRDNTFALIRSCGNEVYRVENRKKILENATQSQLFDDLGRGFMEQK